MGVSDIYTMNSDGTNVDMTTVTSIPYQLEFESQYQFSDIKTDTPWYEQLMSITTDPEKPLLDVYALTAPYQKGGERIKIGHIELLSEITTSKFGDERLFFQHIRGYRDQKLYEGGWAKYDFKRASNMSGWGTSVPDTWPATNAEAKTKYMEQERLFGCPFAWLLGIHTEEDLLNANL